MYDQVLWKGMTCCIWSTLLYACVHFMFYLPLSRNRQLQGRCMGSMAPDLCGLGISLSSWSFWYHSTAWYYLAHIIIIIISNTLEDPLLELWVLISSNNIQLDPVDDYQWAGGLSGKKGASAAFDTMTDNREGAR